MPDKVRVIVVDDSSVMRRLLTTALGADSDFEVVATAPDGQRGVATVAREKPDVLIMDVEMPIMDGIAAATQIRKNAPDLPIVMFSSITTAGAEATFRALEAGASDYAPKPSSVRDFAQAMEMVKTELLAKVKGWGDAISVKDLPLPLPLLPN